MDTDAFVHHCASIVRFLNQDWAGGILEPFLSEQGQLFFEAVG